MVFLISFNERGYFASSLHFELRKKSNIGLIYYCTIRLNDAGRKTIKSSWKTVNSDNKTKW